MHKALFAEEFLALTSPRDRAATMAGDLTEEAGKHGTVWFVGALAGVSLATFFAAFGVARSRVLRQLLVGLLVWAAAYLAARAGGALLGVQPMAIDARSVAEVPIGTFAYLGGTLALANLATGLVLGRRGLVHGLNPAMPLAVFWLTAAAVAFCADLAAGVPTWYCTAVYLVGAPLLYVAPLLAGAALAARSSALPRLGAVP
jgi:hypothetical protein